MNTDQISWVVFAVIVSIFIYLKWRKRTERRANIAKLNELLSMNLINPRDKATIEGFVMGRFYNKRKFESYVAEAKDIKRRMEERRNELVSRYGEEVTSRLLRQESWIGMSKEQLLDSRGKPTKIETEILKTKTKETVIYGNKSSGDYFVVENGLVSKIVDR
jgi:hypothetical protein